MCKTYKSTLLNGGFLVKHRSLIIWLSLILVLSGCGKSDTPQNTDINTNINEEFTQQYQQNDVSNFMSKDKEKEETSAGNDILNGNSSGPDRYNELMLKLENSKKDEESNINIEEEPEQESSEIKEEPDNLEDKSEKSEAESDKIDNKSEDVESTPDNSDEEPIEETNNTEQKETLVYVNNVSRPKFYHSTPNCTKLLTARSLNQMTIDEAIKLGVKACKSCCN